MSGKTARKVPPPEKPSRIIGFLRLQKRFSGLECEQLAGRMVRLPEREVS